MALRFTGGKNQYGDRNMKLLKLLIVSALVLPALCSCTSVNKDLDATYKPQGTITASAGKDWESVLYNTQYRVVNNVWNKKAATGSRFQTVFVENNGSSTGPGWQWDWVNSSGMVVAYPEVIYGDKPWDPLSGIASPFPCQAGLCTITADFDASVNARGVYNMAFSVWCVSGLPEGIDNITHEIMIWTMNRGMKPAGKKYADTVIDGKEYSVYVKGGHTDNSGGSNHSWTYIAFEAKQDITSGPFPVSRFTDYLISQNLLDRTSYITSVELGNEIVSGTGCTEIQNYAVSVDTRTE
ncbi:MAG: hypothetical protein M0P01_06955 [Treponema sp.]|nr:hypothetical protein [Treponema sp.]